MTRFIRLAAVMMALLLAGCSHTTNRDDARPQAWQPQLPKGWTLNDTDTRRELRNPDGKLVTEIAYLNRNGRREPISIVQHAFHYHITIQYLGD